MSYEDNSDKVHPMVVVVTPESCKPGLSEELRAYVERTDVQRDSLEGLRMALQYALGIDLPDPQV
jgi:hypothetical protein